MIKVENLSVAFKDHHMVNREFNLTKQDLTQNTIHNVTKNVDLTINDGEIVGIVGESGSGKSVTALTIMGLLLENAVITSGKITFDGTVLAEAGKKVDRELYRRFQGSEMSMVFQEPMTSLNPTMKVGVQVAEVLRLHTELSGEEIRAKVLESFINVGLLDAERVYDAYPHELSGGMRQRAMIAMAVILEPKLLIADEPTTALDVTVQNQIIHLLKEINTKKKNSMLFITHDLNLARRICDRIVVMKDGLVVEQGATEEIFTAPKQDYTKMLINEVPTHTGKRLAENAAEDPLQVSKDVHSGEADGTQIEAQAAAETILKVTDLDVYYRTGRNSLFSSSKNKKKVVDGVSFEIKKGEILGLVGESGCGKTTLSKAILGINKDYSGTIVHNTAHPRMIFQDPYSSLNPARTIGWLLQEPLRALGTMSKADREAAAYDMLKKIELDEAYFDRKPSEISGGQRQRVSIGQALITNPGFIIADEPVSALDVTIQAQIMQLMIKLQQEMNLSYLFISHDINVIYQMSDRIMVMKSGRIVESGETKRIFEDPKHEYTKELLRS